ncbi:MAG TPA: hypothetical protein VMM76_22835 [Pirellulaceae bacterium]|nr:hypothetical protein [Pirellulaceae bacterium]
MDASQQVAEYFEALIERCNRDPSARPTNLPKNDQIVYYVISTRCEMDINGFDSVFDQLLTEPELQFLIDSLNELGALRLADLFHRAHSRLQHAGFFDDESTLVEDLDQGDTEFLHDIEEEIRNNDSLWELDDRLAELIPNAAK